MTISNTQDMERALVDKLMIHFGKTAEEASEAEILKARTGYQRPDGYP